jgi:hypothetical protein
MARGAKKGGKPKKVAKVGIKKEAGFLYFIDKQGDISCAAMVNRNWSTNMRFPPSCLAGR